jgi:Domain of unknown function (DUF4124)
VKRAGSNQRRAGADAAGIDVGTAMASRRPLGWCILGLVALLLVASPVRAATYKWVDEKGVVHYSDKIPPEAVNKGNVEINKQGVAIKRTDPALTPEQRRALELQEIRRQQLAREREEIDRRDRALLATYTTESEIDLARSRALATIDAQVQGATKYSLLLNKRKVELDAKKAALGDRAAPPVLERELANIDSELQKQVELIAAKKKEISVVNARYELDKKRWADLRAQADATANATLNGTPTAGRR